MTLKDDAIFKEKLTGGLKNEELCQKSYVSWHWRGIQRKANSWEICVLCDAIDLKQSVESTLRENLWQLSWMKFI